MTKFDKYVQRCIDLRDAHRLIEAAFNAQLEWWVFIPFLGIHRILRCQKLLRIGWYLVNQSREIVEQGKRELEENTY